MQIYCLIINTKKYVGKTTQLLSTRISQHLSTLSRGIHHNYKLQEQYNLYGEPEVVVLEDNIQDEDTLNSREIFWIEELDSIKQGLNITPGGNGSGYGENCGGAKRTKDDYLAVLYFLVYSDMSQKEISVELDVPLSIVNNISSGYTHQYLIDLEPDLYKKLLLKRNNRTNKLYIDIVYYNILLDIADSLLTYEEIALKHKVNKSIVGHIASGSRHTYLKDMYPEEYARMLSRNRKHIKNASTLGKSKTKVLSPNGEIYEVSNVRQFSIKHNLTNSAMYRLINGSAKSHKGWTVA